MEARRILVVDDEQGIIDVVADILENICDEVLTATNGVEALDELALNDHKVDCILSDLRMPKMDGLELLKEVRKSHKSLPFIFFSGFGNSETIDKAIDLGAFDFIEKPGFANLELIVKRGLMTGFEVHDKTSKEFSLKKLKRKLRW